MSVTLDDIRRQGFAKTTLLASGWQSETIRPPDLVNALSEVVRQIAREVVTCCPDVTEGSPGWSDMNNAGEHLEAAASDLRDAALALT
jgi:hypothetical protein